MKNMNRKTIWAALPIALVLLWFMASWYASNKAERSLEELLQKHHLQSHVHWEKVKASPFGTVTLKDVRFSFMNDAFFAKKIELSNYKSNENKLSFKLVFSKIQNNQGVTPDELFGSLIAMTGRATIAPSDLMLELDANFKKDSLALSYALDLPEVADFAGQIHATKIVGLKALTQSKGAVRQAEPVGMFGIMSTQALTLASLADIVPTAATLEVKDKGAVERVSTLMKRYLLVPDTTVGNLDKHQDAIFRQELAQLQEACLRETSVIQKTKSSCKNLSAFLSKPGKKLELVFTPTEQVPIGNLIQAFFMWGFGAKVSWPMIEMK